MISITPVAQSGNPGVVFDPSHTLCLIHQQILSTLASKYPWNPAPGHHSHHCLPYKPAQHKEGSGEELAHATVEAEKSPDLPSHAEEPQAGASGEPEKWGLGVGAGH